MKKVICIFILILAFLFPVISLEIREEYSAKTQHILDSICYFYNDYLIIDPLDPDSFIFAEDYSLITLFTRNDGSEVYNNYGYGQTVFLNLKDGKIYGYYQNRLDESKYYGFCVYEKDGTLVKELVDRPQMMEIKNGSIIDLQRTEPLYPYSLDYGFRVYHSIKNDIIIATETGNEVFRSTSLYGSGYVSNRPVFNAKKNRMAFIHLDNDNGIKNYTIKVLAIIYDATCNDTRVRIHEEPNLSCSTLGYLNIGDAVKITDKSDAPFEIDGESWYWYKVESDSIPDGWVYGKYLDIEDKLPGQSISSVSLREVLPFSIEKTYENTILTAYNAPYNYWNFESGIYSIDKMMIHTPKENERSIQELCKYYLFVKGDYLCIYNSKTKQTEFFNGGMSQISLGNSLLNYENLTPETVCIQANSNYLWTLCSNNGSPCLIQRPWIRDERNKELFITFAKDYKGTCNIEYNIPFPWYCVIFRGYSTLDFTTEPDIISQPDYDDLITQNRRVKPIDELQKWIVQLTDRLVTDEGVFYKGLYEGKTIYIKESELGLTYPTLNELLQGIGDAYLGV